MQTSYNTKKKWPNIVLGILGLAMVAVSAYLTHHYFDVIFPRSFSMGSFCDISSFWNCDSAAFSSLGSILNIPTSLFGVVFGLIILGGAIAKKAAITQTNFFLAIFNLLGCLFLMSYSLIFLHGLCPGCTIYYVLSLFTVLVFIAMKAGAPRPKFFILIYYGLFTALLAGATYIYNYERFKKQDASISAWIEEMRKEPIQDDSNLGFELPLVKSTPNFSDAPLRISLFSDFQCPYCKILGNQLEKLAAKYQGKINVQYMFFPLDSTCNDRVSSPKHPLACAAARLSYCARSDFAKIHDDIYAHQENLTQEWILQQVKTHKLEACYESEETKVNVKALIDKSDSFKIEGSPFMLINGRNISGLIPMRALIALLDAFLKDENQK